MTHEVAARIDIVSDTRGNLPALESKALRPTPGQQSSLTLVELQTDRVRLRRWRDDDRAAFAALNADPEVMEHFLTTLTKGESDAFVDRIDTFFERHGYGLWAVDRLDRNQFIGYVGLQPVTFDAHFTPAVEIGWRLAREHWGHGFATEAAREALRYGFDKLKLEEIVSFTATTNSRSVAVMQRLGMTRNPADDFDHPRLPPGHRLTRHVLYRLQREDPRPTLT